MRHGQLVRLGGLRDRGVGEGCVFAVDVDGVDAEAVDTPVEPEADCRVVDSAARGGGLPVQVGLLDCEEVQVVLVALWRVLPGAAAEEAGPVVGRVADRVGVFGVPPDVPVGFGV